MAIQSVTVKIDSSNPNLWYFYVGNTGFPITPAEFQVMMQTVAADGAGAAGN